MGQIRKNWFLKCTKRGPMWFSDVFVPFRGHFLSYPIGINLFYGKYHNFMPLDFDTCFHDCSCNSPLISLFDHFCSTDMHFQSFSIPEEGKTQQNK